MPNFDEIRARVRADCQAHLGDDCTINGRDTRGIFSTAQAAPDMHGRTHDLVVQLLCLPAAEARLCRRGHIVLRGEDRWVIADDGAPRTDGLVEFPLRRNGAG